MCVVRRSHQAKGCVRLLLVCRQSSYYKVDKIDARDHTPQDHQKIPAGFLSALPEVMV